MEDRPELSRRSRRAISLIAAALVSIIVATFLYLRAATPTAPSAELPPPPPTLSGYSAVYDFVTELTTTHAVSDETFARAKRLLGEQQVVDLTAVAGTYVTIAMILAMAEESVPSGKELPFKPGEP